MRPLVLLVHAFGGSPKKFWYHWLGAELGDAAEVDVLRMTAPQAPTVENWVNDLRARVVAAATTEEPRELYLIGHSVGCQTIVRFLAEAGTAELLASSGLTLRGCLAVAAWFAVDNPWETIMPWCSTPIDCAATKRLLAEAACPLRVVLSDNDKYTPGYAANGAAWRERFGAEEAQIVPGRAHFGGKKQPEVLAATLSMLDRTDAPPVAALPPVAVLPPVEATEAPAVGGGLPTELLSLVLGGLDSPAICRAELVSKAWLDAARGDESSSARGGWSIALQRDYPDVSGVGEVRAPGHGGSAHFMYSLAAVKRQCIRCHKGYHVGHNVATACGFHHGVIISGHRDNGMRARWTCCGKWGPTRASGTTPVDLVKNEGYCSWTTHLGSLTSLNTPEDVGACGASEQGPASAGIARHRQRLAHTASSEPEDAVGAETLEAEGMRSADGAEAARSTVNGVRRTLVDEMMHARTVAASQSCSWLGCGE